MRAYARDRMACIPEKRRDKRGLLHACGLMKLRAFCRPYPERPMSPSPQKASGGPCC